ncbi:MAG: hypothetical protein LC101_08365 [Flavobacteriales bacterium]|nr:hypothetical protein [Flavobacteriales bacterium]
MKYLIGFCILLFPLPTIAQFADILSIEKLTITSQVEEKGVKGVQLSAYVYCKTSSAAWDSTTWYIFPEIINKNQKVVFSPTSTPGTYKTTAPRKDYVNLSLAKNTRSLVRFFIPYRRILDNPGKQAFTFRLSICDKRKIITEPLIVSQITDLTLPEVYIVSVDLKSAEVQEGAYDNPGQNIPILGMFFGERSKTGKGYPDVVWDIRIGSDIIFESDEATNEFFAKPDRAVFRISEDDPVLLSVWDNDDFSSDDLIGSKMLTLPVGPFSQVYTNDAFGKVISADYTVQKVSIPLIENIRLTAQTGKYQGVSGLFITTHQQIIGQAPVSIRPIFTNASFIKIASVAFAKIVHGTFSPTSSGKIEIPIQSDDSLVLFIPHYAMHEQMYPAIQYYLEGYNVLIKQHRETTIFSIPSIQDIHFQANIEDEAQVKGVHGVKIVLQIDVPEMYFDDLNPFEFNYDVKITTDDDKDITNLFEPLNRLRDTGYANIRLIRLQKDLSFFIPYHKMSEYDYVNHIHVNIQAKMKTDHLIIGNLNQHLSYTIPSLLQLPYIYMSVNNQHTPSVSYQYHLFQGDTEIGESNTISSGKQDLFIKTDGRYVHPKDQFRIELTGRNREGETRVLGTWSNKGELFLNRKPLRLLSTGKAIKKGKIRFESYEDSK